MHCDSAIPMETVVQFVLDKGLKTKPASGPGGTVGEWSEFSDLVMEAGLLESKEREAAHREEVDELGLQREAGVLDEGQDDYVDLDYDDVAQAERIRGVVDGFGRGELRGNAGSCFSELCEGLGVTVSSRVRSVAQLGDEQTRRLQSSSRAMVGYNYFGMDDPRNHVVAVRPDSKSDAVKFRPLDETSRQDCVHGITSPQEFFNHGGWLYEVRFYSGNEEILQDVPGFGGDTSRPAARSGGGERPPAPGSVVDGGLSGGSANLSGGVVRPKRRGIKSRSDYVTSTEALRTYAVSSATMFNNMEEMYLDTISKEYAQEIIEELFSVWNLPTSDETVMKYAEDVLWAFLIARTASNKADYKFLIDVPTKSGDVEIDFGEFSRLLADKFGITRRNFARGVADNLRDYLRREENQHLRSRSAQRIGADPQMGDMCFDGSTGCTNLTSSEAAFARLLEARNLYERDDVIAEGASDRLMQGMSGGVRSVVPR